MTLQKLRGKYRIVGPAGITPWYAVLLQAAQRYAWLKLTKEKRAMNCFYINRRAR